jgi:HSP20 family protein
LVEAFAIEPPDWFRFARMRRGFADAKVPRVDVVEKDSTLVATAELPGREEGRCPRRNVRRGLVIHGDARSGHEETEHGYVRMERTYGSFYRRIPLEFEITPDQITATLNDGVLEVRVPEPPGKNGAEITIS